jgi:lauroyl/myristoyl acyltransferase
MAMLNGSKHSTAAQKANVPLIAPEDLERAAALILAAGLNVLPGGARVRAIRRLSQLTGTIWHKTNRAVVRRVRQHLQVVFDYEPADEALESLVRDQLVLAGWNALIANLLPLFREEHLAGLLQLEGLHYLDDLRRQDRAILLLGFHYGVYGYAIAATLAARGYPTRLVGYGDARSEPPRTSRLYRKFYFPRLQRVNRWVRTVVIEPDNTSQPEMLKLLEQRDELIYLLADQYFVVPPGRGHPSNLVPLNLMDHTVYLDVTGVRMAKQMGAHSLTVIPVKDERRERVLIEPLGWASDGTTTADIARDLQIYLARLERHLLEYPALWRELRRAELLPRLGIFEGGGGAWQ